MTSLLRRKHPITALKFTVRTALKRRRLWTILGLSLGWSAITVATEPVDSFQARRPATAAAVTTAAPASTSVIANSNSASPAAPNRTGMLSWRISPIIKPIEDDHADSAQTSVGLGTPKQVAVAAAESPAPAPPVAIGQPVAPRRVVVQAADAVNLSATNQLRRANAPAIAQVAYQQVDGGLQLPPSTPNAPVLPGTGDDLVPGIAQPPGSLPPVVPPSVAPDPNSRLPMPIEPDLVEPRNPFQSPAPATPEVPPQAPEPVTPPPANENGLRGDATSPSDRATPSPDFFRNQNPFNRDRAGAQPAAPSLGFGAPGTAARRSALLSCDQLREHVRSRTIDKISLDISPPFRPDILDPQQQEQIRQEFRATQKPRQWFNLRGERVAEGALQDLEFEQVVLKTADGEIQRIPLNMLSEPDLAYLSEAWGLPRQCRLDQPMYEGRQWTQLTMTWKASGLCHKPLYFEEVQLERYGHTAGPVWQPVVSTAHFFVNIAVLPYKMGIHPPSECQYALGYYRPGNCAPWMIPPIPLSLRGALAETAVIAGGITLIP